MLMLVACARPRGPLSRLSSRPWERLSSSSTARSVSGVRQQLRGGTRCAPPLAVHQPGARTGGGWRRMRLAPVVAAGSAGAVWASWCTARSKPDPEAEHYHLVWTPEQIRAVLEKYIENR